MNKAEFENLLRTALSNLASEKPLLPLERRVGERPLVARLAFHLERLLSEADGLRVDVEYNIDPIGDRKWLIAETVLKEAATKVRRKVYEDDSIAVIPDIVVHERGTHARNFAVIEVKFADADKNDFEYAKLKLQTFQRPNFNYSYGVLVSIPRTWESFLKNCKVEFF